MIIGFAAFASPKARLYEYDDVFGDPHEISVENINPYLISYGNTLISPRSKPICDVPPIVYGSKPVDGGHLLLTEEDRKELLAKEPGAKKVIRPLVSAKEFLHGGSRYCLWLEGASPSEIAKLPLVKDRIKKVREFRGQSKKKPTREAANRPAVFAEIRQPRDSYIVVPLHTSENRQYVPFGFFTADYIVHNSCACIPEASLFEFGIISSAMHMAWMQHVCGRLESRFRYANKLVYNTFPWPEVSGKRKSTIEKLSQDVLSARAKYGTSTLAECYDPDIMPTELFRAHQTLDYAVDKLYRRAKFGSNRERVEYLFACYDELTALREAAPKKKKKRARRK